MTITVYRLGKLRHRHEHFSGLGGLYAGGRWTFRGQPVVHTSGTISLAVLEYTLNYRRRGWVPASVLARAMIPSTVRIETLKPTDLPRNWPALNPPLILREIGQDWLDRAGSAILRVPSAVVVEEWNYLLNPRHPDFHRLVFGKPQPYAFYRRLVRSRRR
ncbi:MAG: RES family NAD+ phosphorylase [Steroidobacteraceae bacterium]